MAGKKWTDQERQAIVDGLLRGESKRAIAAGLVRKEPGVKNQVCRMTGRVKNGKRENVVLPRNWAETEEINGVVPDFTIAEDKEMIRWLFDECSGFDGSLFDASRSERSLRGRLLHIQEEFEKLTKSEVQEIFRSIKELLQDSADIDWKELSKAASKAVTHLRVTPTLCFAVFYHGDGARKMADHPTYNNRTPRKKAGSSNPRTQVCPQGPPAEPQGENVVYDDPGIVQSLRFRATDGDRERLQSTIPVVDVERLESPYPPWKQQSFDKDMSEENQLLWQAKIMGTAKHDPRRVSPTVDKLDESKFKGIIHRGDNVCVRIDGGLTLFIFRNAVSHPGVLGYLAQVARDNCMQRRNVRRDDGGSCVNAGYTCGGRSQRTQDNVMSAAWSKSLTRKRYTEQELREINLRDSTAWGILWNVAKQVVPREVTEDYEAAMRAHGLPRMDCNQGGIGEDFDFVIPIDGIQHVLTGLEKAPPCGFAAINYAKETHREIGDAEFVISLTTECDLSVAGGRFYQADAGFLVEREVNTLMVHRTRDSHGTELLDIPPKEKRTYICGLSLNFPDGFCKLWPKSRKLLLDAKNKQTEPAGERDRADTTDEVNGQDSPGFMEDEPMCDIKDDHL